MAKPLSTRRGFWTFAVGGSALAMACGVIAVGLFVHAGVGGFVFMACLLTLAVVFWCWLIYRLVRRSPPT